MNCSKINKIISKDEKNFSRREWLMIIAIFLMAEAWILNISYSFNGEQSVINYVSFASTITSLILAVLAIVYGFYQNETGKKSNAALEAHIDAMKKTQGELDIFVSSVEEQLKSVSGSAEKLEVIGRDLSYSVNKIDDLRGSVEHIKEGQRQNNQNLQDLFNKLTNNSKIFEDKKLDADSNLKGIEGVIAKVFTRSSFTLDLIGVLLVSASESGFKGKMSSLVIRHFANPIANIPVDIENSEFPDIFIAKREISTLAQYGIDMIYMARAFGVAYEDDNENILFKKEYIEIIKNSMTNSPVIKEFSKAILESFK